MSVKLPRPEFFDIFGVFVFTAIVFLSGWALVTGKPIPQAGLLFLFFVGLFGIFIDGTIVNGVYIKKDKH